MSLTDALGIILGIALTIPLVMILAWLNRFYEDIFVPKKYLFKYRIKKINGRKLKMRQFLYELDSLIRRAKRVCSLSDALDCYVPGERYPFKGRDWKDKIKRLVEIKDKFNVSAQEFMSYDWDGWKFLVILEDEIVDFEKYVPSVIHKHHLLRLFW